MVFICLPNELCIDISACLPEGGYVVDVTFPGRWYASVFSDFSIIGHGYSHLSVDGGSVCSQVVPFAELGRVFSPHQSRCFFAEKKLRLRNVFVQ